MRGSAGVVSSGAGGGPPPLGEITGAAGRHQPEPVVEAARQAEGAHTLLAEVSGSFTEGFETADLQQARALLDP